MTSWFFDTAVGWLASAVGSALNLLWSVFIDSALTSPDVGALPQVQAASGRTLAVVDIGYVVLVLAAAVIVMTRETLQTRYAIGDLAPRLVVGFLAANLAPTICRQLIAAGNALTQALTGGPLNDTSAIRRLSSLITSTLRGNGTASLLVVAIGLLVAILTVLLLVGWLTRVGVLVVLASIAPLALACHGLPQTEAVAKLWWRSVLGALAVVTTQALALRITMDVFLSPSANLPELGVPTDPSGTINLLIIVCLLGAIVRLPRFVHRQILRGGAGGGGGVMRVVVAQQLGRGAWQRLGRMAMTRGL